MSYLCNLVSDPSFMGALLGAMISGMFAAILFMVGRYFDNKKSQKIMLKKQEKHKTLITGYLKMLKREIYDISVLANEIKASFYLEDEYFQKYNISLLKADIDKAYEYINKILEIDSDYKSTEVINLSIDAFIKLEEIDSMFKVSLDSRDDPPEEYIESLTSLEDVAGRLAQEIRLFLEDQN
ncbi:hypothetical protein [Pseudogracilibacillus auburnensis]|uniref:hypothetical protein n=1 Tax=Pseudogracilibacillus auburnensis TaxID=1494959 RepID=UPI001A96C4C2|nr:hypothetical protein [Pseudogracilibacillus auburnensis]MBO1005624.1 hypothetical protein [Pseudogracilibacillus auburnensis]